MDEERSCRARIAAEDRLRKTPGDVPLRGDRRLLRGSAAAAPGGSSTRDRQQHQKHDAPHLVTVDGCTAAIEAEA